MQRDFEALARGRFDLLVIGGGIYGAWTAYDAALRGLRVALVERADWGAGTSSASSKLIHGGCAISSTCAWVWSARRSVSVGCSHDLGPIGCGHCDLSFPCVVGLALAE